MGITLCWFSNFNWILEYPSVGSPITSQVFFGKMLTFDPKSRITFPMLKSPIYAFNLNSLLVLFFLWTWLIFFGFVPTPSSMIYLSSILLNKSILFLSLSNLKQDSKKYLSYLLSLFSLVCNYDPKTESYQK
jgi:hypothetical protein